MNRISNFGHKQESRYFHPVLPCRSRGGQNSGVPALSLKLTLQSLGDRGGESSGQLHYLQTLDLWKVGLFQRPCSDFSGIYMLLGDDSGRPHADPEEKEDGEVIGLTT